MSQMPFHKYRPYPVIDLPDRQWPGRAITTAPRWCSVDLRDGNQALAVPMGVAQKREMFSLLTRMGFREIEVGFPSASKAEYDFLRLLIENGLIPEEVTVQVLTQAREHLIKKSFDALKGARRAVLHLYNSTSELQRRVVFRKDRHAIIDLAVKGAGLVREEAERQRGMDITYEYSPESFTGTELDFALEVCEAVMAVWEPTPEKPVILNLPATVEMSTPNIYADQIEWFCSRMSSRDSAIISVHAHNDRGTAVAATELALMAGADRVEGTLFGNGERTGNVDILTLAMNLFSQGIDPRLDFSDIDRIVAAYERCTGIPVHVRHPYAGALVYTAFSGSHQDAINKGLRAYRETKSDHWEVPYLPIDPSDVGRSYESIIRINSQSGKGGVAYIMEEEFGLQLPKEMHPDIGAVVQALSDTTGGEVTPPMLWEAFKAEYIDAVRPYDLGDCRTDSVSTATPACGTSLTAAIMVDGVERTIGGNGNGPIDAFCNAIRTHLGIAMRLTSYFEHALQQGSDATAVCYVEIEDGRGLQKWGAGMDPSIDRASFKAILSGLNRIMKIQR